MRGLVTLAVLAVCAVSAAEDEPWTVGVEMTGSTTKLAEEGVADDWYSSPVSLVVVGTYRGFVENLSVSVRFGGAGEALVRKNGDVEQETRFFPNAFVWGLGVAYGGEIGAGDASWEAGLKMENILGKYDDGTDQKLNDFRFALYGNYVGWTWDTVEVYGGLRLNWVDAKYDDEGGDIDELSQPQPFGVVVGFREKAERLSYSVEIGFLDSTSLSVGAGLSF